MYFMEKVNPIGHAMSPSSLECFCKNWLGVRGTNAFVLEKDKVVFWSSCLAWSFGHIWCVEADVGFKPLSGLFD